eukprot:snap_masked-scaffold_64-processed-gene-0.81-mRNA-1 protein AED:1.00 eAED:1.00 QI:0/0/0/0/1/1/2/0/177
MPFHEDYMHNFTIITPISAYEMVGSPMDWINTPMFFQERMQTEVLGSRFMKEKEGSICWIDDKVIYSSTFKITWKTWLNSWIDSLLNIDKCFPLHKEVGWCGRNISQEGWNFSSKYFDKIMNVKKPYYRHQLPQALRLVNWLSFAVEHLTEYRDYFAKLVDLKKLKAQLKNENVKIE